VTARAALLRLRLRFESIARDAVSRRRVPRSLGSICAVTLLCVRVFANVDMTSVAFVLLKRVQRRAQDDELV
jgi:hypothetical protein